MIDSERSVPPGVREPAVTSGQAGILRTLSATRYVPILVLVFLVSLPAVTTRIYATDEIQYFSYLRSLWFDRDVSFENEYLHFYETGTGAVEGFHETHLEIRTETGRRINFGTIGSALLWAPFYAVADVFVVVARAAGSTVPRDGYSTPYIAAVCYGSAVYGFLSIGLSAFAAAHVTGASPRHVTAAALAIWLGTPLLFYMYLAPVFAHATSAFSVALFVVLWLNVRRHWSLPGVVALGVVGALMIMVREQDVTYVVAPVVDFLWQHVRGPRAARGRAVLAAGAAAVAFGVAFAPQALAYLSLNGRIGPSRLVTRKLDWLSPHAWQVLASPEHGFYFWTPVAALASAGLVFVVIRLWRESPAASSSRVREPRALGIALLAMLMAQTYVLGALQSWSAAGAFGQRRFVGATVLFVIGLAGLLEASPKGWARRALGAGLALCIYWNLALMAQFGMGLMDRQRLELRRNATHAFTTVPARAPELVRRYFADRSSFYRSAPERLERR